MARNDAETQPYRGPYIVIREPGEKRPDTFLRYRLGEGYPKRAYGPKGEDHPSVGRECPACGEPFLAGQYTTLIPLGPGDDPEEREKCREGRWFTAAALEVHLGCVVGIDEPEGSKG